MGARVKVEKESDGSIIMRHRSGDLKAFALLEARHGHSLFTYCRKYYRDPDDAKDACQEVWMIVLGLLSAGKYTDVGKFREWLRVTAFRYIWKMKGILKQMPMVHDERLCEGTGELSDGALVDVEHLERIESLIDELPDRMRLLIVLRLFRKKGWELIARFLNFRGKTPGKELASSLSKEYSRIIAAMKTIFGL